MFEEGFDFQATMFQPVGGMDRIPAAFAKKLGPVVRLMSEVTAIKRRNDGVAIAYTDKRSGKHNSIDAAYCVVTIPLKVLEPIENDFSSPCKAAIRGIEYGNAIKIAWQSRRFWEIDDHIYGGISWVKGPTALVWYPSDRLFSQKGILLGGYVSRGQMDELAAMPLREQFEQSRAAIEGLHPGHGRELEKPMAIAWSKVPYSLGIGARYQSDRDPNYARARRAGRPVLLRRRICEPCRRLAGRRDAVGTARHQHHGQAPTRPACVSADCADRRSGAAAVRGEIVRVTVVADSSPASRRQDRCQETLFRRRVFLRFDAARIVRAETVSPEPHGRRSAFEEGHPPGNWCRALRGARRPTVSSDGETLPLLAFPGRVSQAKAAGRTDIAPE